MSAGVHLDGAYHQAQSYRGRVGIAPNHAANRHAAK